MSWKGNSLPEVSLHLFLRGSKEIMGLLVLFSTRGSNSICYWSKKHFLVFVFEWSGKIYWNRKVANSRVLRAGRGPKTGCPESTSLDQDKNCWYYRNAWLLVFLWIFQHLMLPILCISCGLQNHFNMDTESEKSVSKSSQRGDFSCTSISDSRQWCLQVPVCPRTTFNSLYSYSRNSDLVFPVISLFNSAACQ
jgi:hypothetical protein